jgi:hypothetical protein
MKQEGLHGSSDGERARLMMDRHQLITTRRAKSIVASVTAISAIGLAVLFGISSKRRSEDSRREQGTERLPRSLSDQCTGGDSSAAPQSRPRWPRWLKLPPQWFVFLALAVALIWMGFGYLPPDQSQDLSQEISPTIAISVSRPDIHILAVLDASQATDRTLFLSVYADGVPGGFRWRIESSDGQNDLSTTDSVTENGGQYTDELTGKVNSSNSANYSALTIQSITPDLQAALRRNEYSATVERGVQLDTIDLSEAGANLQVKLPTLEFDGSQSSHSPTGWYSPSGEVAILGPDAAQTLQTNIVDPTLSSPGMWLNAWQIMAPYWSGTDLAVQSQEGRYLFIAGLMFGIAGSAVIASFQDIVIRYRSWRDRRKRDHPKPQSANVE